MDVSGKGTIAVGGGVVAALVLTFILISGNGEIPATQIDTYQVRAIFNKVDGLVPGDDVRMRGVRIGTVAEQSLNENYKALIDLVIDKGVKLPTDTSAAIHTDGLFGSKYVVLEPGGEEEYLGNGGTITFTQDALIITELLELIIAQGKRKAKEAAEAKAQVKEAAKILGELKGVN